MPAHRVSDHHASDVVALHAHGLSRQRQHQEAAQTCVVRSPEFVND